MNKISKVYMSVAMITSVLIFYLACTLVQKELLK